MKVQEGRGRAGLNRLNCLLTSSGVTCVLSNASTLFRSQSRVTVSSTTHRGVKGLPQVEGPLTSSATADHNRGGGRLPTL